jgi:hypothetical protein
MSDDFHRFTVRHDPSGDECEADSRDAAILAARTLLEDNEFDGQCRIFEGDPERRRVVDMVWADRPTAYKHLDTRWN